MIHSNVKNPQIQKSKFSYKATCPKTTWLCCICHWSLAPQRLPIDSWFSPCGNAHERRHPEVAFRESCAAIHPAWTKDWLKKLTATFRRVPFVRNLIELPKDVSIHVFSMKLGTIFLKIRGLDGILHAHCRVAFAALNPSVRRSSREVTLKALVNICTGNILRTVSQWGRGVTSTENHELLRTCGEAWGWQVSWS